MSHYSIGSSVYNHRGRDITSIVGNTQADRYVEKLKPDQTTKPGIVPNEFSSRPDLIADVFLEDPDALWYICLISNKYDVFEDYLTGSRIRVPK